MILLVEDNHDDAALITRELEKQVPANCIRHATNADEAYASIERLNGEALQLILLDLQLKAPASGLELLGRLRKTDSTRHVPVVMLNDNDDRRDVAESYDLGANSVISKGDHGDGFAETIDQIASYWLELNHPYIRPGVKR